MAVIGSNTHFHIKINIVVQLICRSPGNQKVGLSPSFDANAIWDCQDVPAAWGLGTQFRCQRLSVRPRWTH